MVASTEGLLLSL